MKSLKSIFLISLLMVLFLFSTSPSGTDAAIVKLNGTLPTGSLIYDWQASADSGTVVYSTGPGRYYRNALFSVPAGGGTAVQITPPVTGDERVTAYAISPDSSRVVFLIQAHENAPRHLYSVPIGGPFGLAVWLDETLNTQVHTFLFTPDSQKIVYQAVDPNPTYNTWGLYSVPLAGPANNSLRIDGNRNYHVDSGFKISPDSTRVVYRAPCTYAPDAGQSCTGMYSVPISGGSFVKFTIDGAYNEVNSGIEISPDSQYVVYRALYYNPPGMSGQSDLYSIPIAGPINDLLRLSQNHDAPIANWLISPDSSLVLYRAYEGPSSTYELYSIPIRGTTGSGVKLNGPLGTNGQVYEFVIGPDGSRVAYRSGNESGSDTIELYSIPIAGPAGTAIRINQSLFGTGTGARRFRFSPNSQRVVFEIGGNLFGVPAAGPSSQQVHVGTIYDYTMPFGVSRDSSWVYYTYNGDLLKSPIAGPIGNTVKLDGPPNHTLWYPSLDTFLETPDGLKLIYSADQCTNLYAVNADLTISQIFLPLVIR